MRNLTLILMLIASLTLWSQNKTASAYTDDPRLIAPITVSHTIIPLGDLIKEIAATTNTPLYISKELTELKAAIFIKSLPLNEVMSALAKTFDISWERNGEPQHWTYRLYQTQKQKEKIVKLMHLVNVLKTLEARRKLAKYEKIAAKDYSDFLETLKIDMQNINDFGKLIELISKDPALNKEEMILLPKLFNLETKAKERDLDAYMNGSYEPSDYFETELNKLIDTIKSSPLKKYLTSMSNISLGINLSPSAYIEGFLANQMTLNQKEEFWQGKPFYASTKPHGDQLKLPEKIKQMTDQYSDTLHKTTFEHFKSLALENPGNSMYQEVVDMMSKDDKLSNEPVFNDESFSAEFRYESKKGILLNFNSDKMSMLKDSGNQFKLTSIKPTFNMLHSIGIEQAEWYKLRYDPFFSKPIKVPVNESEKDTSYYTTGFDDGLKVEQLVGDGLEWTAKCSPFSYIAEVDRQGNMNKSSDASKVCDLLMSSLATYSGPIEHSENLVTIQAGWEVLERREREIPENFLVSLENQYQLQKGLTLKDWIAFFRKLTPGRQQALVDDTYLCLFDTTPLQEDGESLLSLLASLNLEQNTMLRQGDLPYNSLNEDQKKEFLEIMNKNDAGLVVTTEADPEYYNSLSMRHLSKTETSYRIIIDQGDDPDKIVDFDSSDELQTWLKKNDSKKSKTRFQLFTSEIFQLGKLPSNEEILMKSLQKLTLGDVEEDNRFITTSLDFSHYIPLPKPIKLK